MNEEIVYFHSEDSHYRELDITGFAGSDEVKLNISSEWCGSEESGFGANIDYDLSREEVEKLIAALQQWLAS